MKHPRRLLLTALLLFGAPSAVIAHVKWFAAWSFTDQPRTVGEVLTPIFFALLALTVAALIVAVYLDRRLSTNTYYRRIVAWFNARRDVAPLVLRIGLGMTLMLAWAGDRLLTPDLALPAVAWGTFQFVLVLLLIFPHTTPLAALGTLALYVVGIFEHGAFYMLDYLVFVGVAVYLIVYTSKNPRIRSLRIPALYFTVGFSLMWVAIEKLVYPQWGLDVLAANPALTLGLDPVFFLTAAAFVELALGYLLIIGLLERPMAVVITLVFFTTTTIFGKTEIIGHTIIHAALIVFLLEGTTQGVYRAPIDIHRSLPWRLAFAAVNFIIVLAILLVPYALLAQTTYTDAIAYVRPVLAAISP